MPKITWLTIFVVLTIGLSGCKSVVKTGEIDLSELTISDVHKAYEQGSFTSRQLVEGYLDRIEKLDDKINAITFINPEAVTIAGALDDEYQKTGILRPLHGIPLIIKDNINTKGIPTTAGSLALKDYIPQEDAFIIKKLVDAGAIVLGKSNMAEWAFSPMHTESSTHGITRNPYNLDYVPAGSSGGTAAAIASNFSVIGLGTDTGNSIRGPSSHNALVGFRTTMGLISRSAIVPLYLRNDVVGPMSRSVEDAVKVMEVIAGYDPEDPMTRYSEGRIQSNYSQFLDADGLKGARIGVFRKISENEPDPEINIMFEQALVDMKAMGAVIVDSVVVEDFENLQQNQWCANFRTDLEEFFAIYVKRDKLSTLEDVVSIGTKSEYTRNRLNLFLVNNGRWEKPEIECGDPYTDVKRIDFREAIESKMDFLELSAIVYPSWNNKPARIDFFNEEYRGDNSQIIAPHTGMPAFTVPMGFTKDNLPVGLQFLGRMFDEPVLIKLSYSYEQGTKHRKAPFINPYEK